MKSRRNKFILALIVPLFILVGLLYKPILAYVFGETITVKTVPVDPRDLLYGDYVNLQLDINTVEKEKLSKELRETFSSEKQENGISSNTRIMTVYSILEKDGGTYTVQSVSLQKPKSGLYLKGKIDIWYTDFNMYEYYIDYGLNRFYVEENTGKELENLSAKGELALVLKVAEGYALIEDLIVYEE